MNRKTSAILSLGQLWRNIPLSLKGVVVILLPLSLLMGSIGYLFHTEQQLSNLENQLKIALENQRDVQTVHTRLLEASTAVRDYLLTNDKHFLAVFNQAEQQIPVVLKKLESDLKKQGQTDRLNTITKLVDRNLQSLRVLARNEAEQASDKLIAQFKLQVRSLAELRQEIETLNAEEAALVTQDQHNIALARERNFNITLFAVVAGILGSFIAMWIFSGTIVQRVKSLRDSASNLAKAEPLNLPSSGQDELGQLSDELDLASQLLAKNIDQTRQARLEAERANQSKSMFLSRTSHELRTPLNAILGFAQLLEEDLPNDGAREKASLIKRAGDHLLNLINEVLNIARIESGESSVDLQAVGINDILAEAIHYIAPLGQIRDIDIQHHIEPNLVGMADHQKLLQVVLNVLSNALKYGPVDSTVSVSAFQKDQHIIINILDEGVGIPDDLKSRLFTPFDRLGAEQSTIEGNGLGLALSKQMMTSMNGDITVADHQSLFSITLDASEEHTTSAEKLAQVSTNTNHRTAANMQHQILYIEDNLSNRTLVEAIIKRHADLTLICGSNLHDARTLLKQMTPALLIIDLNLPDGSGEALVQEVVAKHYGDVMPMMVLSADAMPATITRLQEMGVSSYLTKPLDISQFITTVRQLITEHDPDE